MLNLFLALIVGASSHAAPLRPLESPYKLGVILVVDQFRADYLMRFKFSGGYQFLQKGGAYFPLADHGLFQNMTGPGHAAILSGTYPYRHGIASNYWFNRDKNEAEYCVQDDAYKIIGSDGVVKTAKSGISPRNFNATTVGDELKNVDRPSKMVSVAIKERAAVLLGGKRADHVYWFDDKSCQWVTSEYYRKSLPEFVKKQNRFIDTLRSQKFSWGPIKDVGYCSHEALLTPWAIKQTLDLALAALDDQKLGHGTDTDLLAVSISSHDYLGHQFGPNSENLQAMTLAEDQAFDQFIKDIGKRVPGGLSNVFFVLTGDHGVPPSPGAVPKEKIPNENIQTDEVLNLVETTLSKEFGKPKGGKWVQSMIELQMYLNLDALKDAKVTVSQVANVLRPKLIRERYVDQLIVRDEIMMDRKVPAGELGKILDRTLTRRSGDLLVVLNPYHYSDTYPLTHMTHYSYDRYVPLLIWGKTFKSGTYRQVVNVIDLAPTLSSVLSVIPPAQSEGRVLTEILR